MSKHGRWFCKSIAECSLLRRGALARASFFVTDAFLARARPPTNARKCVNACTDLRNEAYTIRYTRHALAAPKRNPVQILVLNLQTDH